MGPSPKGSTGLPSIYFKTHLIATRKMVATAFERLE